MGHEWGQADMYGHLGPNRSALQDGFANEPASSQSQRPINPQLPVNPLLYAGQMPPRGASMTWQLAALLSHHRQQCQQAFYLTLMMMTIWLYRQQARQGTMKEHRQGLT